MSVSSFLCLLMLVSSLPGCVPEVQLRHLSTVYLPYEITDDGPQYGFLEDPAEQSAYDPHSKLVYTVGRGLLQVIDARNVYSPRIVFYFEVDGGVLSDVEICGGYVAVSFTNTRDWLLGRVLVYKAYNPDWYTNPMPLVHNITVGPLPDMLLFTKSCSKILVALEGNLQVVDGQVVDPEGGVGIISFYGGHPSGTPHLKVADFKKFNAHTSEYLSRGVRKAYNGEGTSMTTTLSQDLEPEYIALNDDNTIAYITMQENNAIATLDVRRGEILELYPLGSKSWQYHGLDASDEDGGINIKPWPIHSFYMPDGTVYMTIHGRGYLFTANEGDEKEYETPSFPFEYSDSVKGEKLVEDDLLDPSVSDYLRNALSDKAKLGRLPFSTVDGKNPNTGKIYKPHTYGGRSFSIWDAEDLSLVYDSGGLMEYITERYHPRIFNSNPGSGTPTSKRDSRSDNKGPEPESIAVGKLNDKVVIFVGNERPGTLAIFSIKHGDLRHPLVEGMYYGGGLGAEWQELYDRRIARDVDPEDIKFVPGWESPNRQPLLIVTGTDSGTVSFHQVVDVNPPWSRTSSATSTTRVHTFFILCLCLATIMFSYL